jgi:exopolyphosphatase/guanosine-5'-triphosphate,3'-diphosphate pyrophosphatase
MPKFAALDVGSNALRLRIIEAHGPSSAAGARAQLPLLPNERENPNTGWTEILSLRAPVRLGSEVFITGKLTPASIGQACSALRQFRDAMDAEGVDAYRATATSAVREASNGATLVERARREARIDLEVIEGVEEARLIQLAVVRRLALQNRRAMLIDVGGGSTELTFLDKGQTAFAMSLPLGTVRLLETFLRGVHSIDRGRVKMMGETIDRALDEPAAQLRKIQFEVLVGTGGNVETLADLCPVRGGFAGHPRAIDVGSMRTLMARLCGMSPAERRESYNLRPDRADTIVPSSTIFLRAAELFRVAAIVVPGAGLKEGILEELVDKYFDVWDAAGEAQNVLSACTRLGQRYHFDEPHAELVAKLAAQLFDDLRNIHAFGDRDLLLLQCGALLHDVGDFVRYDAHHKHSYYIIQHSDIMGLTPEERAIVANLARYHRKSVPDPSHANFRELDKVSRGKVRGLAGILRIADALDREHRGKVESVRAEIDASKHRILLRLRGAEDRELEEWTVRSKAELLRDVFDLDIAVAPSPAQPVPVARSSSSQLPRSAPQSPAQSAGAKQSPAQSAGAKQTPALGSSASQATPGAGAKTESEEPESGEVTPAKRAGGA